MRTQWKYPWFMGLLGAVLAIPALSPLLAQDNIEQRNRLPSTTKEPTTLDTRLRKDVDLVLMNVTVLDSAQKVMTGLRKEDVQNRDNRKEQPIRYFSTEDMPISLTVVLDASGSMEAKLSKAIQVAMRLFVLASPNDDCRLMLVRDTPGSYIVPKDLADVHSVLDTLKSKEYTALWDSIYLAANDLQKRAQYSRKAMVVISDGGDNRSRYTENELRRLLVETDVRVYGVDLHNPFSRLSGERSGPTSLDGFARVTGGHMYAAMDRAALLSSIENINMELRNQYVLGYMPDTLDHNDEWRKVKITVRRAAGMPKLHVTARRSYYVPVD